MASGEVGRRMMHGAKTMGGDPGEKSYSGILAEPMPKWGALTRPSDKEVEELIDEKLGIVRSL
jgi:hypothetical protein